jgi:hypothetical protein
MATTQYIGSRYVPVFADPIDWDNTKAYEPLTIVTHEGNSYTSKQYVPTGIDIANMSYWALTGNYNAQIEQYRKEVRDILPYDEAPTEGSTKGVTSDGIKKAIDTAEQTNTTAIANEVTRAKTAEQTNATAIANEVTRAKTAEQTTDATIAKNATITPKRNFIIMGDSFSSGIYPTGTGEYSNSPYGWANYCVSYPAANVANVYYNPKVVRVGNAGFTSEQKWIDRLSDFIDSGVISDPDTITDIVVLGGTNEVYTDNALDVAISEFVSKAKSIYKNADVRIGVLGTDIRGKLSQVYNAYARCVNYGAGFVAQSYMLLNNPSYVSTDGTHLTSTGYQVYAPTIADIVFRNRQTYNNTYIPEVQFANGVNAALQFQWALTQSMTSLRCRQPGNPYQGTFILQNYNRDAATTIVNHFSQYAPKSDISGLTIDVYAQMTLMDGTNVPGGGQLYYDASTDSLMLSNVRNYVNYSQQTIRMCQIYLPLTSVNLISNTILPA